MSSKRRALVLLAEGNEDIEVTLPLYIFRRAGIETILAGVGDDEIITCDQYLKIKPDMPLEEARKTGPFDVIFVPGGLRGAPNLANSELVGEVLKEQEKADRLVASICFSPAYAITKFGIYEGKNITCYPKDDIKQRIFDKNVHTRLEQGIVEDGNLITAQGPAYTTGIALAVVKRLVGEAKVEEITKYMLLDKI